ncbi:thiolase family protein [Mycolicibacterium baixiangningiae]|uniref:thiolase family protein n=1 Tax=Mycolicibacterium baixiangningiae TaxID=2761578 RepID=UPI001866FC15|nr:thiolase family protein [Mycolicibacterium baixiangningiae]
MTGREVAIVEAVRLPVGRGHVKKGYYRDVHPSTLLAATYTALVERTGIDPGIVEDVAAGCCEQWAEQGMNIGRNAWLEAGLPVEVPAATIDRQCGSSQQAINYAAALIASGVHDIAIGAGVEHMGRISIEKAEEVMSTYGRPFSEALMQRHALVHQGISAEMIADKWALSRTALDEIAVQSHVRAARATDEGRFEREIVPFSVGDETLTTDQGIRPDTTVERLGTLRPAFLEDGTGKLTAGNSSQISDGAAGVLLVERQKAVDLGLPVRAVIVDQVTVGVDPVIMLTGPIPATAKILARNNITMPDIDLFEINEAFASVVGAWQQEYDADMAKVNVNGGAIALGHAMGATGARLITTLLHELERSDKELGLVSMCVGGGLGTATLIKRV